MSSPRALVASDAHLGAVPAEQERRFLAFLDAVPGRADELVLAGDVFDFWFEWKHVIQGEHFPVLRRLADVVDAGVRVRMVGGNHDAWGGRFLEREVGLELVEGPIVTEVGGRRTFLAHGDGLAGGDLGYRILKKVIRSRPARILFRALHPDLAIPLVRRISGTGGEVAAEGETAGVRIRAEVLSDHADEVLRARPDVELVVLGHAHRPELREVEPGRHYFALSGWMIFGLDALTNVDVLSLGGYLRFVGRTCPTLTAVLLFLGETYLDEDLVRRLRWDLADSFVARRSSIVRGYLLRVADMGTLLRLGANLTGTLFRRVFQLVADRDVEMAAGLLRDRLEYDQMDRVRALTKEDLTPLLAGGGPRTRSCALKALGYL